MYWNTVTEKDANGKKMININMRCIEMIPTGGTVEAISRLTLTWDVLKWYFTISKPLFISD